MKREWNPIAQMVVSFSLCLVACLGSMPAEAENLGPMSLRLHGAANGDIHAPGKEKKGVIDGKSDPDGEVTVYSPEECIGPIVMGECKGTILPKLGYHEKCYGTWLNGRCIGPQF